MRWIRIPLLAIFALISLLLCAATITLWIRSYSGSDYISRGKLVHSEEQVATSHYHILTFTRGSIRLSSEDHTYYSHQITMPVHSLDAPAHWSRGRLGVGHQYWYDLPVRTFWNRIGFHEFSGGLETSFGSTSIKGIAMPAALPTLVLAILPGLWVGRAIRKLRRHKIGLCPNCGYDIRATPQRCPECGRVTLANH